MNERQHLLKNTIERCTTLILKLQGSKKEAELTQLNQPNISSGTWYINRNANIYYQFERKIGSVITLVRHNEVIKVTSTELQNHYVLAEADDVKRHLQHLISKGYKPLDTPSTFANAHDYIRHLKSEIVRDLSDLPKAQPKGFDVTKCDFYMITVGEEHATNPSKTRHLSYDKAEKEAIRLCEQTKKEAFIVGVVSSVKPIETREVNITVKPQVNRR